MSNFIRLLTCLQLAMYGFNVSPEEIGNVDVRVNYASFCQVTKMPFLHIENDRWPVTKKKISVQLNCNTTSDSHHLALSLPKKQDSPFYRTMVVQNKKIHSNLRIGHNSADKVRRIIALKKGHTSIVVDFEVVVINKRRLIGPINVSLPLDIDLF